MELQIFSVVNQTIHKRVSVRNDLVTNRIFQSPLNFMILFFFSPSNRSCIISQFLKLDLKVCHILVFLLSFNMIFSSIQLMNTSRKISLFNYAFDTSQVIVSLYPIASEAITHFYQVLASLSRWNVAKRDFSNSE